MLSGYRGYKDLSGGLKDYKRVAKFSMAMTKLYAEQNHYFVQKRHSPNEFLVRTPPYPSHLKPTFFWGGGWEEGRGSKMSKK